MRIVELDMKIKPDAIGDAGKGECRNYSVIAQWDNPDDDYLLPEVEGKAEFNFGQLTRDLSDPNPAAYGIQLTRYVFGDEKIKRVYHGARTAMRALKGYLRIRLTIDPAAHELHELRWEMLRDPLNENTTLFNSERVLFSRYIESDEDWWSESLKPRSSLRALVVIANPRDEKNQWKLAPVEVEEWLKAVDNALSQAGSTLGQKVPVPYLPLAQCGQATLDNLIDTMLKGEGQREGFDILILVCHGDVKDGKPGLYMEGADGSVKVQSGIDLVERDQQIAAPPTVDCALQLRKCRPGHRTERTGRGEAGIPGAGLGDARRAGA